MEKRNVNKNLVAALLIVVAVLGYGLIGKAGNLEPSAAPAPTMKTLDEIEPGTPISSVPYTIDSSGSYYLSANAETTSSMFSGITIWASNVTLDLKGFSLIGDGTAGLHGVVIDGDYKNITIRNGTITNWGGNGVEAATATKCRVEDLQVIDNAGSGIRLGGNEQRVKNCVVSDNGTSAAAISVYGIYVNEISIVTGCTVSNNGNSAASHVHGIHTFSRCTVTDNTVVKNGTSAIGVVYGIYSGSSGTVTGNTANHNGDSATGNVYGIAAGSMVTGNTASSNGTGASGSVCGIQASGSSTVTGNTANSNGTSAAGGDVYGISIENGSTVAGNTARNNGYSAYYVNGIYAGTGSTVTGNTAYRNGVSAGGPVYGIYLDGYNLVDQNTAYANNGTNMNDPGNCTFGVNLPQLP